MGDMKNKEEKIRSASWYPEQIMDEGVVIEILKKQVKTLKSRVKELEGELQSIAEDAAGEDL